MQVDWKGVFTALVTPFKKDGSLDEEGLKTLVRRQVKAGIHGLVPCGTTGESPALNEAEWERIIEIVVTEVGGKTQVVAGSGTNNTNVSAARTRRVAELGADGALVISPYYNKPTPDGLIRHFSMVAEAAPELPIMVYNVPGRTALNMTPDIIAKLVEIPSVVAVKEASGNLAQVWEIVGRVASDAVVFSGEDALNLPIWDIGGMGTVSVLSNIVPQMVVDQWLARIMGHGEKAYNLHRSLERLAKVLFIETSPAPAKFALAAMGLPAGEVRPPLAPLRESSKDEVSRVLKRMKLVD